MLKHDAVSTKIAADFLECSTRHVQNLFWKGVLQGFLVGEGRGLRIYKTSLEAWKHRDNEILSESGESGESGE